MRELRKVIERSDVIIQVLDSRDPEGTRSRWVEEEVRKRDMDGKKLLAVMNKIGKYSYSVYDFSLIGRFGTSGQSRSVDEAPSTLVPRHAIQVLDPISTPQPIPERRAHRHSTIIPPSWSSGPICASTSHNLIVPWCPSTTPPAQAICPLYTSLVLDGRGGRIPECRQVVVDQLAEKE